MTGAEGSPPLPGDAASLAATLREVLAQLRAALLGGRIEAVDALMAQAQALSAALEAARPAPDLTGLRALALEAGACAPLARAAAGEMRALRQRLGEIARAQNHLDTYGPSGRREDLAHAAPAFERRR
ncbi:MAG: hypothetical protein JJU40_13880 [Rhodobacteraceae bacterium]|nr:hypothetical protein [Paracoccaceae bacterium]